MLSKAEANELKDLLSKRNKIQTKFNRFIRFIESDNIDLEELEIRFTNAESCLSEFENMQHRIAALEPEVNHDAIWEDFENLYYSNIKTAKNILKNSLTLPSVQAQTHDIPTRLNNVNTDTLPVSRISLPQINIEPFHDKYVDLKDYGDIQYSIGEEARENMPPNMRDYADVAGCNQEVSRNVENIIKDGRFCLTLGGDHSIGVGTVDGHIKAKNENVCVLWVDAHADLNTNQTSPSGNVHGMPMALLARELSDYWPYLPGMDWQKPVISIRNVAYIGLRSVDTYERLVIEKLGIAAYGMEDIENHGISTIVNMALDRIDPEKERSIHVSYDIDSLDTLEAPSTGTSVRGGLSLREGIHIMETVYKTGRLTAMDLVEVNPGIGTDAEVKRTVEAAIHIIMAACGYTRRGLRQADVYTLPLQTFPPTQQLI